MEFRRKAIAAVFAATPPLEALRILAGCLATLPESGRPRAVMKVLDVKRAYFHARALRRVFVQLPPEDHRHGQAGVCGELLMSMYGTRDAAANWEATYSQVLCDAGFKKGYACPCVF